jgi:hypothetical protein
VTTNESRATLATEVLCQVDQLRRLRDASLYLKPDGLIRVWWGTTGR